MTGFEQDAVPLRGELRAHCYRMLASWDDADDALQETYLRAWRAWEGFEGRASVRTWLYRIATRVCLDAAAGRAARALPADVDALGPDLPGSSRPVRWIGPFPGDSDDLRLAFIAVLQSLPPSQRAVLLLRDVLGFSAAESAELLETSVPAVKSTLQRARRRVAREAPVAADVVEPRDPAVRRLVEAYIGAFARGDVDLLLSVLRADAVLELVPEGFARAGKAACAPVLADAVAHSGTWEMTPATVNGAPGAVVRLDGSPYGATVLDVRPDGIARITVFRDPSLPRRLA
ncbi:RNA polymerase subunit sigma-70 [Microbacterium ulmi]|uniref:RNA polymerase subunit sigma-70 n=1 Tax=Microbacterium ulmi TaxID=179095 RepID=UPI001ABB27F1|nr:RNA polymerase sigma-70 factor (ECF subfamily) [Microbacterium ulmi]